MSESLANIEKRRKQLRMMIRWNRHRDRWYRPLSRMRLRRWRDEYESLGLEWGIRRPGTGLNLTGAILLNDDGERIDSDEFKHIANNKIFGDDSVGYSLKAEYHVINTIITRPDGTTEVVTTQTGPGVEVPASEPYIMSEAETEPIKIYRKPQSD